MAVKTFMSSIEQGKLFATSSLQVLGHSKSIVGLIIYGLLSDLLLLSFFIISGLHTQVVSIDDWSQYVGFKPDWWTIVCVILVYTLLVLNNIFVAACVTHRAVSYFANNRTSWNTTAAVIWRKRKDLIVFGLLNSLLGVIFVELIGKLPFVGKVVTVVADVTWSVASVFAVAAIINNEKPTTPSEALKQSTNIVKKAWKQGVSLQVHMGIIALLTIGALYIPYMLIARLIFLVSHQNMTASISVMIVGIVGLLCIFAIFNILVVIARTALFYCVYKGETPEMFNKALIRSGMTKAKAQKIFS
jgi:hypothetical protein